MKSLKLLLHSLFSLTNVIIAILMIASAYSDYVSPEKSLVMAYLGLAFPVFFIGNLCFLLCWLFTRKWRPLLISLVALLICWKPVTTYFPYHRTVNPVPTENVIKVLTYNVMNFGGKRHTPLSPNKIVQYIAQSDADIVCLQEYAVAKSEKELNAATLFKALDMYPYRAVTELNSAHYRNSGVAVFSKYPITRSREINYDSKYNGSSIHEININGKKLTLVNNHLESFRLTQEDKSQYANLIKSMDSDMLEGIRGTFQQKLGPAFIKRARQAHTVAEEIEKTNGDYILVCGDFNDTPLSYAHRVMQGNLKDAFAESGSGMGVTYNQNIFRLRIDNILHSSNMKAFNCTIDKVKYSDHYPMWCYLQLN